MHGWSTLADLVQSWATLKGSGPTGVYPPAVLLEVGLLVQHAKKGMASGISLASKSLLLIVALRADYWHARMLRRLGLYSIVVLFLERLTTRVTLHATRMSLVHLLSSLLTLCVNARLTSVADLNLLGQLIRIVGSCVRLRNAPRQWSTLWTTLALVLESGVALQILHMQPICQLPRVLVWPKVLEDEFASLGTSPRSKNLRSGRFMFVRRRENPHQDAMLLAKQKSGIFSRPDRHMYFQTLRSLHHPNVHRHDDFIEVLRMQYFVLASVPHKPLNQFLEKFTKVPEGVAQQVLLQALQGLQYIHDSSVTHRDIKLENILVNSSAVCVWTQYGKDHESFELDRLGLSRNPWPAGSVLITNFDRMATHIPQTGLQSGSIVGTAHYSAPEIQKRKYNSTVDIWSLGVLGYVLLVAEFPYDTDPSIRSGIEVVRVVCRKRKVKWPVGSTASHSSIECIEQMLTHSPVTRPTATACLQHKWLAASTRIRGGVAIEEFGPVLDVSANSVSLLCISLRPKH